MMIHTQHSTETSFQPLVSVIIPVYNGAAYLAQAIDSVLKQHYVPIEILVINDGSSDGGSTEQIVHRYGSKIRYFSKPNGGVSSALNLGIREMQGEYFSWLSHDDIYHPDKLLLQVQVLSKLQDKETILYGGYDLINAKGKKTGAVNLQQDHSPSQLQTPLFPVMRGLVNGCTLLIAKTLFERVGVFREDLRTTQDYELWARLFRAAPIHFLEKNLVQTRIHPEQGTFKVNNHVEECSRLWEGLIDGVSQQEAEQIDGCYAAFLIRSQQFLERTPYADAYKAVSVKVEEALSTIQVSVVIPFYNRIPQTLEAIASVRHQSHANLEIILVNDGSTDDVAPVLALLKEDSRLHYIAIANAGPATARNAGIALAQGDYIAFLDSDDVFLPGKIAVQLECMLLENAVFSHTSYFIKQEKKEASVISHAQTFSGHVYPEIIHMCPIATPTVMILRSYLGEQRFNEAYRIGEDICMWIDLSRNAPLCAVSEPLTVVHVNAHNSSSQQFSHLLRSAMHIGTHVCNSAQHQEQIAYVVDLLYDATAGVVGWKKRWYKDLRLLLRLYYVEAFFKTLVQHGPRETIRRIGKRVGFSSLLS